MPTRPARSSRRSPGTTGATEIEPASDASPSAQPPPAPEKKTSARTCRRPPRWRTGWPSARPARYSPAAAVCPLIDSAPGQDHHLLARGLVPRWRRAASSAGNSDQHGPGVALGARRCSIDQAGRTCPSRRSSWSIHVEVGASRSTRVAVPVESSVMGFAPAGRMAVSWAMASGLGDDIGVLGVQVEQVLQRAGPGARSARTPPAPPSSNPACSASTALARTQPGGGIPADDGRGVERERRSATRRGRSRRTTRVVLGDHQFTGAGWRGGGRRRTVNRRRRPQAGDLDREQPAPRHRAASLTAVKRTGSRRLWRRRPPGAALAGAALEAPSGRRADRPRGRP